MPRALPSIPWPRRSPMSRIALRSVLLPVLGVIGVLVIWTVISETVTRELSSPLRTWQESRRYVLEPFFKDGEMNQGIGRLAFYSLLRVGKGFLLAVAIGTPRGFLLGLSRAVHQSFDRIGGLVEGAREPEQESERRADGHGEQEAFPHPQQRVEGEAADALVHLSVLEERLQHVAARLLPRPERRRQLPRHRLADHGPDHEHADDPQHRQQHASQCDARHGRSPSRLLKKRMTTALLFST